MRIATWNVEHAAGRAMNERRLGLIRSVDADIWILTETHDDIDLSLTGHHAVNTDPRPTSREGGRWTTIWSRHPVVELVPLADTVRTAAALLDTPLGSLLVCGTVLPWGTDRGPRGDAKGWAEHHRVIPIQGQEWAQLRAKHPDAAMCVAGDFNMNLGGRHYYGTNKGREALRSALDGADLVCTTETSKIPNGALEHPPIDHVCLSENLARDSRVRRAWEGCTADGVRLSDHSGLVVSTSRNTPVVPTPK